MLKRLLVVTVLATCFSFPPADVAEAGPLRDKIKSALSLARQDTRGVLRAGAMKIKCVLKGKRGAVIC